MKYCYTGYIIDVDTENTIASITRENYDEVKKKCNEYIDSNQLNAYAMILDTSDKYCD